MKPGKKRLRRWSQATQVECQFAPAMGATPIEKKPQVRWARFPGHEGWHTVTSYDPEDDPFSNGSIPAGALIFEILADVPPDCHMLHLGKGLWLPHPCLPAGAIPPGYAPTPIHHLIRFASFAPRWARIYARPLESPYEGVMEPRS